MISTIVPLGRNFPPHSPDRKVKSDKRLNQLPSTRLQNSQLGHLVLHPEAPCPPKLLPAAWPWQMPDLKPKSFSKLVVGVLGLLSRYGLSKNLNNMVVVVGKTPANAHFFSDTSMKLFQTVTNITSR